MRQLWSAANVAVYGGGARETEFLRDLSELIGEYERPNRIVSHGKSGRQVSTQYQRERILDVADLQAYPAAVPWCSPPVPGPRSCRPFPG